jgi:hypothetical protein
MTQGIKEGVRPIHITSFKNRTPSVAGKLEQPNIPPLSEDVVTLSSAKDEATGVPADSPLAGEPTPAQAAQAARYLASSMPNNPQITLTHLQKAWS